MIPYSTNDALVTTDNLMLAKLPMESYQNGGHDSINNKISKHKCVSTGLVKLVPR